MKINTDQILLDVYGKELVTSNGKEFVPITLGEVLINELNVSNASPKLLWGVLPKLGAGGEVDLNVEQVAIIKKVLEGSMEKDPEKRYYKLVVYGRILDILEGKQNA